jgi:uncharacterized protein (DUF433 family)
MDDSRSYVREDEHGVLRVSDSHVMLDSVVAAFQQGHAAETIQGQYPSLTLEQVYGAIAYYLGHEEEVEEYLRRQDAAWEQGRRTASRNTAPVLARLRAMKRTAAVQHP